MARAISVRLDDEADKALRTLEATGLTQSEAIRAALLGEVAHRRRSQQLAAEVAALEADAADRQEMLAVAEFMESIALRGDVHRFRLPRGIGHEQHGDRFAVVVQADEFLPRSVVIVAPTSRSARAASFRPEAQIQGSTTRILVEQIGAVDTDRLGELTGHLTLGEMWGVDEALAAVLGLR